MRMIWVDRALCVTCTGWFSWIKAVRKIDDDELHRMVGMDHYVLIRHCLFGFKLTAMSVPKELMPILR